MNKKHIITLSVLVAAFALLLTLALLGKFVWGWFDEPESSTPIQADLELGESYYYFAGSALNDVVLMYPQYDRSDLYRVRIKNTKGENYFFLNTQTQTEDYYLLGECDEEGNFTNEDLYRPPLTQSMKDFSYSSLYDDTTKIPQMIAAVGAPVIIERIRPENGGKLTENFLHKYGLAAADEPAYFEILPYARDPENDSYLYTPIEGDGEIIRLIDGKYYYVEKNPDYNEDDPNSKMYITGKEYTDGASTLTPAADTDGVRRVYVGKRTIDDSGYYIYLEGRDVVYTTNSTYLADLVNEGIGYYIAPQLVTASQENQVYVLTPGFTIRDGNYVDAIGTVIPAGATIGITTESMIQMESDGGDPKTEQKNMYTLLDLETPGALEELAAALAGKRVGDVIDVLIPTEALAKIGETVNYTIIAVRGIVKGDEYLEDSGDLLTGDEKIVVAYTDGTPALDGSSSQTFYGYIDLAAQTTPAKVREELVGLTVGAKQLNIPYMKTYDGVGENLFTFLYSVTEIKSVVGADGTSLEKVDYGTTVTFSYRLYEEGEEVSNASMRIEIPAAGTGEGQFDNEDTWLDMVGGTGQNADKLAYLMKRLTEGLLGKSVGTTVDEDGNSTLEIAIPYVVEFIYDYDLYSNAKIGYFMEYEETLSFAFKNERKLFNGSSLYEIDPGSDKALYSLDNDATSDVLSLFENLQGDETVAIGIDDETIDRYGLYAYHLRFVMPYDCYSKDFGDKTYYYSGYEVPYDLYISATQPDGSRYVGSVQYDTVVRVDDGSIFDFLEWSFSAKWMQNGLMLLSYQYLRRMVFDLNFSEEDGEDFNSVWGFDITVDPKYQYPYQIIENGILKTEYEEMARLYAAVVNLGAHDGVKDYAALNGLMKYQVTTYDPTKDNKNTLAGKLAHAVTETLGEYKELINEGWQDLDAVYGNVLTDNNVDMMGSDSLRDLLRILNATYYSGEAAEDLDETQIKEIMAGEYTMRLALTLLDQTEKGTKEQGYTLTFYNYGVNSLVTVTDAETGATSSLFYVRSREVVRIAQTVVKLTRGMEIDPDEY